MKVANQLSTKDEAIRIASEVMILFNMYVMSQGMQHKCKTLEAFLHSINEENQMNEIVIGYVNSLDKEELTKLRRSTHRYSANRMSRLRMTFISLAEEVIDNIIELPSLTEKLMTLSMAIESNDDYHVTAQ